MMTVSRNTFAIFVPDNHSVRFYRVIAMTNPSALISRGAVLPADDAADWLGDLASWRSVTRTGAATPPRLPLMPGMTTWSAVYGVSPAPTPW